MAGVCSNRQIGTLRNPGGHAILLLKPGVQAVRLMTATKRMQIRCGNTSYL